MTNNQNILPSTFIKPIDEIASQYNSPFGLFKQQNYIISTVIQQQRDFKKNENVLPWNIATFYSLLPTIFFYFWLVEESFSIRPSPVRSFKQMISFAKYILHTFLFVPFCLIFRHFFPLEGWSPFDFIFRSYLLKNRYFRILHFLLWSECRTDFIFGVILFYFRRKQFSILWIFFICLSMHVLLILILTLIFFDIILYFWELKGL